MKHTLRISMILVGIFYFFATQSYAQAAKVTPLMTRDLAGITGKEVVMIAVEYSPGGSSEKHRHNANTFVYVLEGSITMKVEGGKAVTLGPGDTFYESPTDTHIVSKNASKTHAARFLVFLIKDKEKEK